MPELPEKSKLVWLGLARSEKDLSSINEEIKRLRETFDSVEDFKDQVDVDSYPDFEDELQNNGWTEEQTQRFSQKLRLEFPSWDDMSDVFQDLNEFEELKQFFDTRLSLESESKTEEGQPIAGIRFHDTGGVSHNGVSLSPGTVEIYGGRIEFSRTGRPSGDSIDVSVSNLDVPSEANINEEIDIVAEVENTGDTKGSAYVVLQEEAQVVDRKRITLAPGDSQMVVFTRSYGRSQSISITIEDAPEQVLRVRGN